MKLSWLSKVALIALISTTISAQEAQINCTTPAQTEKEEQTPAEKQAPKLSEKDAAIGGLLLLLLMAAILDADKKQKQEAEDAAKNVQEKEKQAAQESITVA